MSVSWPTVSGGPARRSVPGIWLSTLRRPEDEVGQAAALGVQLALTLQPVPPGGAQVGVVLGHVGETDVGHPLAGLPVAGGLVEVLGAMPARAPHPAQHVEGLIRLATHLQAPPAGTAVRG